MNLSRSLTAWRKERTTAYELNRLSDRELEDLGMARGDIADIARRAAR
ncbi:MAG: DUF1127 domain-containing protein [Ahrensia sp.]